MLKHLSRATLTGTAAFIGTCAISAEIDPALFDGNRNGILEKSEATVWLMHQQDPVLAKLDINRDGRLSPYEAGAYAASSRADLERLRERVAFDAEFYVGRRVEQVLKAAPAPTPSDPCKTPQRVYIRRDRLDTFQYRNVAEDLSVNPQTQPSYAIGTVPRKAAKGASLSYTHNELTRTEQFSVNGRASAVIARLDPACATYNTDPSNPFSVPDPNAPLTAGYLIAPWVEAQGTRTRPRPRAERNSLQTGIDAQLAIVGGPLFNLQYFVLAPYVQTDFDGLTRAAGARAGWEPFIQELNLGGRFGAPNPYLDWFWQIRAEGDFKQVDRPGTTALVNDRYGWLGGTVRAHVNLFPNRSAIFSFENTPFAALTDRVWASATYQHFWDAYSHRKVQLYSTEVAYNLTQDGTAAISLQYTRGTEKDNLERMNKYVLGLAVKY